MVTVIGYTATIDLRHASATMPTHMLTWQCTKKSRDTESLVRVVLGLRHIWHVTYSTIYFRRSDSMYLGTYLPGARYEQQICNSQVGVLKRNNTDVGSHQHPFYSIYQVHLK